MVDKEKKQTRQETNSATAGMMHMPVEVGEVLMDPVLLLVIALAEVVSLELCWYCT